MNIYELCNTGVLNDRIINLMHEFGEYEDYKLLWEHSDNEDDFIDSLRLDENIKYRQITGLIFSENIECLIEILGENQFDLECTLEYIKIGTEDFHMQFPISSCEDIIKIGILDKDALFNRYAFNFVAQFDGELNIYAGDDNNDIYCTLQGKYNIYIRKCCVIFEEVED